MNILFFTEISPFPINGGERIRSYGLLKTLSELNHNVISIIQNQDNIDLNDYNIDNVQLMEYTISRQTIFDYLALSQYFIKDKNVLNLFQQLLNVNKFDLVILDYYTAGKYISFFKKIKVPVVIGTHNFESDLIWQQPSNSVLKFIRKAQNYFLMYLHERFFYKQANKLITVSDLDTDSHSSFYSKSNIHMIPNFLDEKRYNLSVERENYFIMTANFEAYMNFEGLKWLLSDVWNEYMDSNYKLFLVGKKSNQAFNQLKKHKKFKNVISLGQVDDINPYIAKAKAVLIPLLHGSGSRLKCLEAMALKTPIISTSKGVEGIESNNIIIANSAIEFRDKIKITEYDKNLGERLYSDFIRNYSIKANSNRIRVMLDSLNS